MLIKFGTFEMCIELRAKRLMKCVLFAVNICVCGMLFLTCTEHTSTMSSVGKTQDYGYLHLVKRPVKFWSLRDDVCRIESQKDMKCLVCHKCMYMHIM